MKGSELKNILILVLCVALGVLITLIVVNQKKEKTKPEENAVNTKNEDNKNNRISDKTDDITVESGNKNKKEPVKPKTETLYEAEVYDAYHVFLDAWNRKDYKVQANLIASDFIYQDDQQTQNRSAYLENKRKRFGNYNWISVDASGEKVTLKGNAGSITYYQHYDSPTYESWGYNTIYFRKTNGKVEIIKEVFRPTERRKK
jgi:hypothetical protein